MMKNVSLILVLAGSALLTACETDRVVEHRHSYSEPVRYRRAYYSERPRRVYYREPVRRVYYRNYGYRNDENWYDADRVALRYSGAPASPAAVNLGF
jgi:hypothetical protein